MNMRRLPMRLTVTLSVLAAMICTFPARADKPVDATNLAQFEALIEYCVMNHPQSAAKYKELGKLLIANFSEAEIAAIRKSPEYLSARESVDETLGRAPKKQAPEACTSALGVNG